MHWLDTAPDFATDLDKAFRSSGVSLTLADPSMPDAPLVAVNDAFCEMTGYTPEQALGRNCRFLQPSGGAGPVRQRMREFLKDDGSDEDKFVVPNVTREGREFLNLVYMNKLRRDGEVILILGSQFDVSGKSATAVDMYETALREDVRQIGKVAGEQGAVMIGSYTSLASSHAIIARARLERKEARS